MNTIHASPIRAPARRRPSRGEKKSHFYFIYFFSQAHHGQLNPWIINSLTFQRKLQMDQPLVKFEMPGTHNSAISQAYGFGIEEDGVEALLGIDLYKWVASWGTRGVWIACLPINYTACSHPTCALLL
jgi:hypothetical protein